jgi:hypothetical protein
MNSRFSPDAVSQGPDERDQWHGHEESREVGEYRGRRVESDYLLQVRNEVGPEGIGPERAQGSDREDEHYLSAVVPDRFPDGDALDVLGALDPSERGCLLHPEPYPQPHKGKWTSHQKRDAPAPRSVGGVRHYRRECQHGQSAKQRRQGRESRRDGGVKPLLPSGAYSVMKEVEPVNSPPPEKPWTSRKRASRSGARMPTCA